MSIGHLLARRLGVLIALAVLSSMACNGANGGGLVGPSDTPRGLLATGPHLLEFGACGRGSGARLPFRVTVIRDGAGWVVRSGSTDDGDLEMRLAEGAFALGALAVTGTASGIAVSDAQPPTRSTFSLGASQSPARVTGFVSTIEVAGNPLAFGTASGAVSASTPDGSGTCEQTTWGIRRVP